MAVLWSNIFILESDFVALLADWHLMKSKMATGKDTKTVYNLQI